MYFTFVKQNFYREEPDPLQVFLWESARKVTDSYTEDEWKKISVKGVIRRYTEHLMAIAFSAPKADTQVDLFSWLLNHNLFYFS